MNAFRRKLLALLVGAPFLVHLVDHGVGLLLGSLPLTDTLFHEGSPGFLWWHFLSQLSGLLAGVVLWRGVHLPGGGRNGP